MRFILPALLIAMFATTPALSQMPYNGPIGVLPGLKTLPSAPPQQTPVLKIPPNTYFQSNSIYGDTRMENMTWMEIRDALNAGKTTVIVPTGGTEQNGPHLALGKHNAVMRLTSLKIAAQLGNALVAPVLPFVPEGDFSATTGNMHLPGTFTLMPNTFAAVLEDTARSLKRHGFKTICFIGDHGGSQQVQKEVAEKLTAEWKSEHVKVLHISDYYDERNGQNAYIASTGIKDPNPQAHGGLADTSELMVASKPDVRNRLRSAYTPQNMDKLGVEGPSDRASFDLGLKLIDLKVTAAVKQIQSER